MQEVSGYKRARELYISGLQKGPAERGHVKKRQKSSKSVKKFFDTFRQFSRRAKNVKNRQKVSKSFSTLFDNFRAAPFFRPLLQSADYTQPVLSVWEGPLFCRLISCCDCLSFLAWQEDLQGIIRERERHSRQNQHRTHELSHESAGKMLTRVSTKMPMKTFTKVAFLRVEWATVCSLKYTRKGLFGVHLVCFHLLPSSVNNRRT